MIKRTFIFMILFLSTLSVFAQGPSFISFDSSCDPVHDFCITFKADVSLRSPIIMTKFYDIYYKNGNSHTRYATGGSFAYPLTTNMVIHVAAAKANGFRSGSFGVDQINYQIPPSNCIISIPSAVQLVPSKYTILIAKNSSGFTCNISR